MSENKITLVSEAPITVAGSGRGVETPFNEFERWEPETLLELRLGDIIKQQWGTNWERPTWLATMFMNPSVSWMDDLELDVHAYHPDAYVRELPRLMWIAALTRCLRMATQGAWQWKTAVSEGGQSAGYVYEPRVINRMGQGILGWLSNEHRRITPSPDGDLLAEIRRAPIEGAIEGGAS